MAQRQLGQFGLAGSRSPEIFARAKPNWFTLVSGLADLVPTGSSTAFAEIRNHDPP
jgi:hypothetical protein